MGRLQSDREKFIIKYKPRWGRDPQRREERPVPPAVFGIVSCTGWLKNWLAEADCFSYSSSSSIQSCSGWNIHCRRVCMSRAKKYNFLYGILKGRCSLGKHKRRLYCSQWIADTLPKRMEPC